MKFEKTFTKVGFTPAVDRVGEALPARQTPEFQFPVRRRDTDIRMTRTPTAVIVHATDANPSITHATKGLGDTKLIISLKRKATAPTPNTTRSPTNGDLIATEAAMKIVNMSPKISTGSRSSGTYLPIYRVVRDFGKASYMQKAKKPNSAARLRSTDGCADVTVEPYKLQRLLPRLHISRRKKNSVAEKPISRTKTVISVTGRLCSGAKRPCFVTNTHWSFSKRTCLATNPYRFATNRHCFSANQPCFAATQHCFVITQHCFVVNRHRFVANQCCFVAKTTYFMTPQLPVVSTRKATYLRGHFALR